MSISKSNIIWAGSLQSYREYLDIMALMEQAPPTAEMEAKAYFDDDEDEDDKFQGYGYMVQQIGSTAVLDISGGLIPKSSWLSRLFGMTGYDEIQNAALAAAAEPGIETILLDVNSPGGRVNGLGEAADTLKAIDEDVMPVATFTSGSMHSAAMWLGSAGREIFATPMANVGSIGVIATHFDISKMLEKEGVKPTVLTAGRYKGVGNPYEPLSDVDKAYLQKDLDATYGFFISAVAQNRGLSEQHVRENAADGKTFYAEEAKLVGLVDTISTFESVVSVLNSSDNVRNQQLSVGI